MGENVVAFSKPVGATDGAAVGRAYELAAVITTGRRCSISGNGSVTAILSRNIIKRYSTRILRHIRKCSKLHGSDGHGNGEAWDLGGVYSPGKTAIPNSDFLLIRVDLQLTKYLCHHKLGGQLTTADSTTDAQNTNDETISKGAACDP